jgi:hypothetical protein
MMQDPIKNSGSDGNIGKNIIPLRDSLVRSKDGISFLITPCDELKKQIRTLNVHRKITNFVDYEQLVLAESSEFIGQAIPVASIKA